MAQAGPQDQRFFVGTVDNFEDFERAIGGAGQIHASADVDGGCAVLVGSKLQYRETFADQLGPNAYMVETVDEAQKIYQAVCDGRPYEPAHRLSEPA